MTLILFLPSQLCAFLAFSLPLLSHVSFPSILVVGPHWKLLSPGPLVTINNQSGLQARAWLETATPSNLKCKHVIDEHSKMQVCRNQMSTRAIQLPSSKLHCSSTMDTFNHVSYINQDSVHEAVIFI